MKKTEFESIPIFSVGVHKFYEPKLAKLAKKIVYENEDILQRCENSENNFTNFKYQNVMKHTIDEEYKNKEDVLKVKDKILQNALNVLNLYGYVSDSCGRNGKHKTEYEVTNLWFNITKSGGSQEVHHHYGFVLSGTFYINTPKNSSPIVFVSPIGNILPYNGLLSEKEEYNIFNSKTWRIFPKAGEMYFWLSWLPHFVPEKDFDGDRISCAFDISNKI